MSQLVVPNDASVVSIGGRAARKAITIQNRDDEPCYINTVKSQLEADVTDGIKLEQDQSYSISGVRGEAAVAFHIAKGIGAAAGSVVYTEIV